MIIISKSLLIENYQLKNPFCIIIYLLMQMGNQDNWDEEAYLIVSAIISLCLLVILGLYFFRWRPTCIPIMQVLAILIFNEVLESVFEMLSYIKDVDGVLCIISLTGRLAFTVAANFWIIFITRLIYREKLAPGKYFNLVNFMLKNMVMSYIPSLIVTVFLLIVIVFSNFPLSDGCSPVISAESVQEYVVYIVCFILPDLISSIIVMGFLFFYWKLAGRKWTIFLLFPLVSLVYSFYYLAIKIDQFQIEQRQPLLEIPLIAEPLTFGILFLVIYYRQRPHEKAEPSDITLEDSGIEKSFIEQV